MKTVTVLLVVLLPALVLPATVHGSEHFFRFGGGVAFMNMTDFNNGVEQMNEILRNSYRRDLWAMYPDWDEAGIENEVNAAARGNTLDQLDMGIGFFFTFGHKFGDNLALAVEIERIIGANDIVHNPTVAMSYDAPATFYKLIAELELLESNRFSFGLGAGVGWAQATGFLKMPVREPRPGLEDAYLSGNGLLVEGVGTAYYELSEGLDVFGMLGYRLAELSESDQTWFRESDGGSPPGSVIPIDTSIPLQLDYSGFFVRLGLRADWPW